MSKKPNIIPDYESVTPFLKGQASKIFKEVADNDKVLIVQKQNKPQNVIISYKRYLELKKDGADITIMDKDRPTVPYIIVELKKPKLTDGKEQLKSYCNVTGAPIGVWTNGEQVSCYNRKDPNFFEMISDIPKATQQLSDILSEKYTYDDLRSRDKISKEKRSLRNLIKEMEDEVLASAGVDSFEEIFKLIFAKLYDELICANDKAAYLQFRNSGDTDFELKEKIQGLFDDAKKKWEVRNENEKIKRTGNFC